MTKNEDWIVERGGDIVEKRAQSGLGSLTDWEHLVYCLWVADYMMRDAGDFENAGVVYPEFQSEAERCAGKLGLKEAQRTFALSQDDLARHYFERFEEVCTEIRDAGEGEPRGR